jgi:hypothetical protein
MTFMGIVDINWLKVIGNCTTAGSRTWRCGCNERDWVLLPPGVAPVRPHPENVVWAMLL